jgi:hypothetical protein
MNKVYIIYIKQLNYIVNKEYINYYSIIKIEYIQHSNKVIVVVVVVVVVVVIVVVMFIYYIL